MGQTKIGKDQHQDSSVVTQAVKLSVIDYTYAPGGTVATNSASFVDVGGSVTYTTGSTPERILVWFHCMGISNGAAPIHTTLSFNGVDQPDICLYNNSSAVWAKAERLYIYDAPANTAVVIKMRYKAEGGSSNVTFHNASPYNASIRGFAISNA